MTRAWLDVTRPSQGVESESRVLEVRDSSQVTSHKNATRVATRVESRVTSQHLWGSLSQFATLSAPNYWKTQFSLPQTQFLMIKVIFWSWLVPSFESQKSYPVHNMFFDWESVECHQEKLAIKSSSLLGRHINNNELSMFYSSLRLSLMFCTAQNGNNQV